MSTRMTAARITALLSTMFFLLTASLVSPAIADAAPGVRLGHPPAPASTDPTETSGRGARAAVEVAGIDTSDREAVTTAYRETFLPANAVKAPTPSADQLNSCTPGSAPATLQDAMLTSVNYFRAMSQLAPVTFDPARSAQAQQMALMIAANNSLSHDPPADWKCWTADGADAAAHSNLALGYTGADVVAGYMTDDGANNTMAGHRWWIQRPTTTVMGNGTVGRGNALWVVSDEDAEPVTSPAYTTWPTAGYFPRQLEPKGRWSFAASDPNADLSTATVTVTGPNGGLPVSIYPRPNWFGSVVFEVGALPKPSADNVDAYQVTVAGILVDGSPIDPVNYTVSLFDPSWVPAPAPLTATDPPSITGSARIGETLQAEAPTWSYPGVSTTYRWLRDGASISKATTTSYKLTTADLGHRISVRATGTLSGFANATTTSPPTAKITKNPATVNLTGSSPGEGKVKIKISIEADRSPAGSVKVNEGSKTRKSKITIRSSGQGSWSASKIKGGNHTYTVIYSGNGSVSGATDKITIKVKPIVKLKSYANCAKLRKDYPHGVGKTDAEDSTSGDPVTDFFRHNKLYSYNAGKSRHPGEKDLDRDNDGIACEA